MEADSFQNLLQRLCDSHESQVQALQKEVEYLSARLSTQKVIVELGEEVGVNVELDAEDQGRHAQASPGTDVSLELTNDVQNTAAAASRRDPSYCVLQRPSDASENSNELPRSTLVRTEETEKDARVTYNSGSASVGFSLAASSTFGDSGDRNSGHTVHPVGRNAGLFNHNGLNRTLTLFEKWSKHSSQDCDTNALFFSRATEEDYFSQKRLTGRMPNRQKVRLSSFIASPGSNWRLVWDISGAVFIGYDTVAIPFTLSFQPAESTLGLTMDWITMLFWSTDMVATFFVGYVDNGVNILQPTKIAKRYFMTWFLLDLIVIAAGWFHIAADASGSSGSVDGLGRMLRSLRAIRVLRLLRLLKLRNIMAKLQDHIVSEHTYLLLSLGRNMCFIVFLNHAIACAWYFLGRISSGGNEGQANWIEANRMSSRSLAYKYTTSMHWTLTQFTPASMEIFPQNTGERTMSVAVLMFAMVAFSSFVGSISTSMTQLRLMNHDINKQFWLLRRYIKQQNISKIVGMRILKYLEFVIEQHHGKVQKDSIPILDFLSEQLQEELAFAEMCPKVSSHSVFKYMLNIVQWPGMDMVLRKFCAAMSSVTIATGDCLFYPGDEGTYCYCFLSGRLSYSIETGQPKRTIEEMEVVSEAAMYVSWVHVGKMQADAETDLITWEAARFVDICSNSVIPWTPLSAFALTWFDLFTKIDIPSDVIRDDHFNIEIKAFAEQPRLDRQGRSTMAAAGSVSTVATAISRIASLNSRGSRE